MKPPKIYLETSIFNHYFDQKSFAQDATKILFKNISAGEFEAYTSFYVVQELERAKEPKRLNMLSLIPQHGIKMLNASNEVENLSAKYAASGIIPMKYEYDGLHIACATVNKLEYIVSLNFKHINKLKTKTMTAEINSKEGYKPISIISPLEMEV
jgi:predicted nucleic acid-binding protein